MESPPQLPYLATKGKNGIRGVFFFFDRKGGPHGLLGQQQQQAHQYKQEFDVRKYIGRSTIRYGQIR